MKRLVYSWSTAEPSSVELGRAISEGNRRRNEKFAPFEISNTYMNRWSLNSTGYRITLDDTEWILNEVSSRSWNPLYQLYGPFDAGVIETWNQLHKYEPIGDFKNLNSAMTYLFENTDVE